MLFWNSFSLSVRKSHPNIEGERRALYKPNRRRRNQQTRRCSQLYPPHVFLIICINKPLFKLGPTQSSSYHQLCGECNPHSQKNHNKAPYECSHSTCPQCADQDWPFLDDFYHVRRKTPGFSPGDIRREVFVYRYTNPPDGTIETLADGKFLLPMP